MADVGLIQILPQPGALAMSVIGAGGPGWLLRGTPSNGTDSSGPWLSLTTDAANRAPACFQSDRAWFRRGWGTELIYRVQTGTSKTAMRICVGVASVPPHKMASPLAHGAWFRFDSGQDGTDFWRTVTSDGSGTFETTITTAAITTSDDYTLRISFAGSSVKFYVDGTLAATHSVTLPGATTDLIWGVWGASLEAVEKTLSIGPCQVGIVNVTMGDHGTLTGLGDDDHTQYALLAGRSSGQTVKGGTASGETLTLESTAHATKGGVRLASGEWLRVSEVSAPATPAAGTVNIYAKSDGKLYAMDDAGTEYDLTASGSGSAHTIKEAGSSLTARTGLNFLAGFDLTDDAGNDETEVALDLTEYGGAAYIVGVVDGSANKIIDFETAVSPVNHWEFHNSATGNAVELHAHGTDTNISMDFKPEGTGRMMENGAALYKTGGPDVALADGGTGASLADPGADRIMFWDDSAGQTTWLEAGSGLSISGTTITATSSGTTHVMIRKAADESVTTSTSLQDDDDFALPYSAGDVWIFELTLFVTGDTGGDIQVAFGGTVAGLAGHYGVIAPAASATFDTAAPESASTGDIETIGFSGLTTARNIGLAGSGTAVTILIKGSFTSPLNSGTLTFRWAQRVSSGTATTVKSSSHMIAHKL